MKLVQLSTMVYHPKLHQIGKQFLILVLIQLVLVWHWWVWSSAPDLRVVINSCTLLFPWFYLLRFGLYLSGFRIGNDWFRLSKITYTIVHWCYLLSLMLMNCIVMPKFSCLKCGLWKNGNVNTRGAHTGLGTWNIYNAVHISCNR